MKTTGEILEYCWAQRARAAVYAAIPFAVTATVNVGAAIAGLDLTNPAEPNPLLLVLVIVNVIVFLPFTVTWYRLIVLGEEDLVNRPLFTLSGLEGQLLVWQIIVILIVIGIGLIGAIVISAVIGAVAAALGPGAQVLSAAALGMWGIFMISVMCRLSLVLPMAATGRQAILSEAWGRTRGIGMRMAATFILCVLAMFALLIPAQFIVVTASAIVGLVAQGVAETVSMALELVLGALFTVINTMVPATLFAFVYVRISESLSGQSASSQPEDPPFISTNDDGGSETAASSEEEMNAVLEDLGAYMDGKSKDTPEDMRALLDGYFGPMGLPDGVTTEDFEADGVPCRWVCANDADPERVIMLLHGGGFTAGGLTSHQRLAADVSAYCGARVVLVDYRLAPEHPFPAGLDDCVTVYKWLLEGGYKPGHIALLGDSAGGGLVASTALRLKEETIDQPAAIVALSPWANLACDGETMETKAKDDPITTRDALVGMASLYVQDEDVRDPFISPIYGDLRGLPPLLIQVGMREVLLDDSRKLAVRARADDVPVILEQWPHMIHTWHLWSDKLTDGRRALGGIGAFVRKQMG